MLNKTKTIMRKVLAISLLWASFCFPLAAQNYFTTLDFLKWPVEPAALGRGESGTASASGIQSLTFNPAHVNQLKSGEAFYNRRTFRDFFRISRSYFIAGAAYRFKEKHILTLYWRKFSYEERPMIIPYGSNQETYENYDMALGMVYGRRLGENLLGGVTLKYLRSSIASFAGKDITANSWAFDLGINRVNLFPSLTVRPSGEVGGEFIKAIGKPDTSRGLNIGAALLNAGPHIAYIDESQADPIPQRLRIGIACQVVSSDIIGLQALFDLEKELVHAEPGKKADAYYKAWFTGWQGKTFKEAIYHFGIEVQLISILKFRYGYRYEPFQVDFEKGISTIGFSVETQYATFHYGKWIDKDNISPLYGGSYVVGVSVGSIPF